MVSKKGFAKVIRLLLDNGLRFTIIGGTIVELTLGKKDLGNDIDAFAEYPSVIVDEDEYKLIAEENGWVIGQTWLGTPRILVRVEDEEVPVEFYDNIYDFYVPENILQNAKKTKVGDVNVKIVTLEDHIVLKAHAGRGKDIDRLKEIARYTKKGKLKLNVSKIKEAASLFDDSKVILRRLRDSGFKI